jgi:hypothetical protein
MSTEVHNVGPDFVKVVHQPGNGTRYEAVGVKMPDQFQSIGGSWLVSFPLLGTAHYFREKGFLAVAYVAEKFKYDRCGLAVGEVDLHEMTKVITTITGGTNNADTNAKGYFPHLRIA